MRLERMHLLVVKEPHTPITFKLNIIEPLTPGQLTLLALATPWKTIAVETEIHDWNSNTRCFDATISVIEGQPKTQAPKHMKRLRWGHVKRKRGFISHD
jgi:hypothetical protein